MAEKEYIEREEALDCFACDLGKKDYSVSYQGFMTEAAFRINDIPAADVRPVVRGKWIDVTWCGEDYLSCSICGYGALAHERTNFCPNCGADMRKNEDRTD